MVKNRYKTLVSRQRKEFPHLKSEHSLLKTLINPEYAEKHSGKQEVLEEQKFQLVQVKDEFKSSEIEKKGELKMEEKREEEKIESKKQHVSEPFDLANVIREEEEKQESKNVPQTSSAVFEPVPQIFSPWQMGFQQWTPTYSPFFVNVPTFSAFDASFSNQFYRPGERSSDRPEQL